MSTENKIRIAFLVLAAIAVLNYAFTSNYSRLEVVSCDRELICQVYDHEKHTVYWVGTGVEGLYSDVSDLQRDLQAAQQ